VLEVSANGRVGRGQQYEGGSWVGRKKGDK